MTPHDTLHPPNLVDIQHITDSAVLCSALSVPQPVFTVTEKALTRAISWLKAPTSVFTFKTLLRHYAKQALTPWLVDVKLGHRRKSHKGRVGWLA